jgi:hypothetical protein
MNRAQLEAEAVNWIPEHMIGALSRYVFDGLQPGSFLEAVLSNDLRRAAERADEYNRDNIVNWVTLLYNYVPASCWGSPEKYHQWVDIGGYNGVLKMQQEDRNDA